MSICHKALSVSNDGKVSCSRNQQRPSMVFKLTPDLRCFRLTNRFITPFSFSCLKWARQDHHGHLVCFWTLLEIDLCQISSLVKYCWNKKQTKKQQIFFFKLEKQSDTMESCFQGHTIQFDTIQNNTIPYNTIQYKMIQYKTMQYKTIQCNTKVYCIKYIYIYTYSCMPLDIFLIEWSF